MADSIFTEPLNTSETDDIRRKTVNNNQNTASYSGTLRLSAFNISEGMPASDTSVSVSDSSGRLVYEGETDSDGRLSPLILSAPSSELSLTPLAQPPSDPFSSYDITARSKKGDVTRITGVQIYPQTVSLQTIIFPGQSSDIVIPDPGIMGKDPEKIPEEEKKPSPSPGGSVVLPQPVIPETIIVHDGIQEDRSAKNYYVGFQDYIKNVASSEIYATWPEQAIRANVLAILSFTLNRVYTEWYRGKGYDFTITSSTAYDQAFTYGRNFFNEISQIVDEMFTLYITREDSSQPLFAQYCDGIRISRSGWLSQWGSKELADSGYDALRILRTYYGRNIILREAEKVEGIPVSFQGVLTLGSRGQAVRTLQQQLNGISDNYPLIPKLSADGIYGPKTANSVKLFQQIFNLPQTGVTDLATWYRISDVYVAVKKL